MVAIMDSEIYIASLVQTMPESGLAIGVWQKAKPLVRFRSSHLYQFAAASDKAAAEWRVFLDAERERGRTIKDVFAARDNGDGRMLTWSSTCRTAADIQQEGVQNCAEG